MDGWGDTLKLAAAAGLLVLAAGLVWPRKLVRLHRKTRRWLSRAFGKPSRRLAIAPSRPIKRSWTPLSSTAPFKLQRFWVVDGDTIQDNATKTIYRLENIDCPETEDRGKCYRERKQGERAKFEAIRLLKGANTIIVRPTGKIDQYGRSIATIDIDGLDYGRLMIERGFAVPWRGVREDWCGPNGGLARMAEACSAKFHCKTCGGRAGVEIPKTPPTEPPQPAN